MHMLRTISPALACRVAVSLISRHRAPAARMADQPLADAHRPQARPTRHLDETTSHEMAQDDLSALTGDIEDDGPFD